MTSSGQTGQSLLHLQGSPGAWLLLLESYKHFLIGNLCVQCVFNLCCSMANVSHYISATVSHYISKIWTESIFFLMWVLLSCCDEPRYKDVCGTAVLRSMLQAGVFKIRGRKCSIEVVKWQVWSWYEEGAACNAWFDCQSPRRVWL